jgi:hypothetical protein
LDCLVLAESDFFSLVREYGERVAPLVHPWCTLGALTEAGTSDLWTQGIQKISSIGKYGHE